MPPEQKVVITGASRGRGESPVKGLCRIGYGAIVNARSIEKRGERSVAALEVDIAVVSTGDRIVTAAVNCFGWLNR